MLVIVMTFVYNKSLLQTVDSFMKDTTLVSKSNALIEAEYTLNLVAQRVIVLAIIEARNQGDLIKACGSLRIKATDYQQNFNCALPMAYESLKSACDNLYEADFCYWDKDELDRDRFNKSRFVRKASYVKGGGYVEITFGDDVIPLITRLSERYTEYELKQIKDLNSVYALRLFELLMKWQSTGKTAPINISDLRNRLGVEEKQYKQMCDFKKRVLDSAVKEINDNTNIKVKYEQVKEGRKIIAFTFKFTVKKSPKKPVMNTRDPDTIDIFTGVTDKGVKAFKPMTIGQITFFASLLAKDSSFNSSENGLIANVGESDKDYHMRVQRSLNDYENQVKWLDYLLKHDFKTE